MIVVDLRCESRWPIGSIDWLVWPAIISIRRVGEAIVKPKKRNLPEYLEKEKNWSDCVLMLVSQFETFRYHSALNLILNLRIIENCNINERRKTKIPDNGPAKTDHPFFINLFCLEFNKKFFRLNEKYCVSTWARSLKRVNDFLSLECCAVFKSERKKGKD